MLRALKTKLANILRVQAEIATEPFVAELRGLREQLTTLHALVERNARTVGEQLTTLHALVERNARTVGEQLTTLHALVERNARTVDNERRDMDETQRMVGVACARIENFIKLQKEHRAAMEQSLAALLSDRVRAAETA